MFKLQAPFSKVDIAITENEKKIISKTTGFHNFT